MATGQKQSRQRHYQPRKEIAGHANHKQNDQQFSPLIVEPEGQHFHKTCQALPVLSKGPDRNQDSKQ